jgi:hypothetical protein
MGVLLGQQFEDTLQIPQCRGCIDYFRQRTGFGRGGRSSVALRSK